MNPIPSVKIKDVKRGDDIIVGHHLLIAPALALDKKLNIDEGSFFDFCTLINMSSIHKRLIVLPGRLDETILQSTLYQYLIDDGILHKLEFPYIENSDETDKKEAQELLGEEVTDDDFRHVMEGTLYYDELLHRYGEFSVQNPELENNTPEMREKFVNQVIEAAKSFPGKPVYRDPTLTRAQELTLYAHRLRTASYWVLAGL